MGGLLEMSCALMILTPSQKSSSHVPG